MGEVDSFRGSEDAFLMPAGGSALSDPVRYRNPYRDPKKAREYIYQEFAGSEHPGGMLRQLIYLRAVLTVGSRLSFQVRDAAGNARGEEYFLARLVRRIVKRNQYESTTILQNQILSEQEGSLLVRPRFVEDALLPDEMEGITVDLETRVRRLREYRVVGGNQPLLAGDASDRRSGDPLRVQGVVFEKQEAAPRDVLAAERCSLFRHTANIEDFDPPPPVAAVIPFIQFYQSIFLQKRANLSYFAKVILHFTLAEGTVASRLKSVIQNIVGSQRAVLGHRGDVKFVEPSGNAARVLAEEQDYLAQHFAGVMGVPPFYLGLLRIMRNKATPKETLGLLKIVFEPIRNDLVAEYYPDVMRKAIEQWLLGVVCRREQKPLTHYVDEARRLRPERVAEFRAARARVLADRGCPDYEPDLITCQLPPITIEELDHLRENLTAHATNGMISRETYARLAPDLPDDEATRLPPPEITASAGA